MAEKTAVVVTTEHRGVFFGYGDPELKPDRQINLSNCRMCISWGAKTKGVVGLASIGPQVDCRVTPAAPVVNLNGVTSIMVCSEQAASRWEEGLWQN